MTIDYAKITVGKIKDMLVEEGRFTKEEIDTLNVTGKKNWVNIHKGITDTNNEVVWDIENELDNLIEDVEDSKVVVEPTIVKDPDIPNYKDAGWNDYVMAQFAPEELIDGKYPNVNALRRMVELLLGEISFSGPIKTESTMDPNHSGKATVVYQVTIDWTLGAFYDGAIGQEGYPQKTFTSIASSWTGNTDDMFAVFPESIAETRAEGRALRRALRINVVCADELTKKDTAAIVQQQQNSQPTTGEWEENDLISDAQIKTITTLCNRLDINITKFINSGSKTYPSIDKVTRATAAGMMKQLNRFQSSGSDSIDIPLNLIGD